ncbi:sugar transferase [uncultured Adlercreutzia sp.]|uniref:sugar transferase n=1 Tax=uncultured Adlercreutzia sp. TaxID=875803 RepID=UPI0025F903E9|nr:sugar transferase [uncultured Adlercreutzia sp.]
MAVKARWHNGYGLEAKPREGLYSRYIKRVLDFCIALVSLALFWWLLLAVAILVRIKLGSPVIFKQPRPGRGERVFMLYKFRSMTDKTDAAGELLSDEARLTDFGKKLRSTSLDELPELLNILKGDMAFVGPRPLLIEYLSLYNARQKRRHDVRPGLTGLAQCSGRNALSWEERFELDVEYVENCSFGLDLSIILKTVKSVLRREGVSSFTSVTMEPFRGSHE